MYLDPHSYKRKLERKIEKIKSCKELSPQNRRQIFEYRDEILSRGLSIPRIEKSITHLFYMCLMYKRPLGRASKKDVKGLVRDIEMKDEWAYNTKRDYKIILKLFFRFIKDSENYPEEVKWINTAPDNSKRKLPEDMLTEEDVKSMIKSATNQRDRAIISVLYESGMRVGELLNMRLRNIQPNKHGFMVKVSGKTGERRILLIFSAPSLASWLENHPFKDDPKSPLWVTRFNKMKDVSRMSTESGDTYSILDYKSVYVILRRLARKSNVKKKVNPHNFRHSRATFLASRLTEQQLKMYMGWTQSSDMVARYVHMSGREVDSSLLKIYGIEEETGSDESILKISDCPRCGQSNDVVSKFCKRCGSPLDEQTAFNLTETKQTLSEITEKLLEDKDVRSLLEKKIEKL